jgi:hypothetical protein
MSKISTYPISANVVLNDKLIGTDTEDESKTKNYSVESILELIRLVSLTLPVYADNAAAIAAGESAGKLYRNAGDGTSSSVVCIVY